MFCAAPACSTATPACCQLANYRPRSVAVYLGMAFVIPDRYQTGQLLPSQCCGVHCLLLSAFVCSASTGTARLCLWCACQCACPWRCTRRELRVLTCPCLCRCACLCRTCPCRRRYSCLRRRSGSCRRGRVRTCLCLSCLGINEQSAAHHTLQSRFRHTARGHCPPVLGLHRRLRTA